MPQMTVAWENHRVQGYDVAPSLHWIHALNFQNIQKSKHVPNLFEPTAINSVTTMQQVSRLSQLHCSSIVSVLKSPNGMAMSISAASCGELRHRPWIRGTWDMKVPACHCRLRLQPLIAELQAMVSFAQHATQWHLSLKMWRLSFLLMTALYSFGTLKSNLTLLNSHLNQTFARFQAANESTPHKTAVMTDSTNLQLHMQ